jgi:hypothetical protein
MNRSGDEFLMKVLAATATVTAAEADRLAQWWRRDRAAGEALAAFLIRHQVLAPNALAMLDLMERGYLHFSDGLHLLRDPEQAPARPAPAAAVPAPAPALADTVASTPVVAVVPLGDAAPTVATDAAHRRPAEGLRIGATLGKCLLTEVLGQGGGGTVYRALHQGLNIPVAVKVFPHGPGGELPIAARQLRHEARLLAQLNHPNVVRILDFADDPQGTYLVMEFVEGLTLADLIRQGGRVEQRRALAVVRQVAEALAAAHRLGIVHRDVKPANVLLTREGTAKLADLGLALVVGTEDDRQIVGTALYMAPEQSTGAVPLDHRADQYALGATWYHAVTGQPPFNGETPLAVLVQHASAPPVPPHQLLPHLHPAVSALILRLLAKAPADRFATYADLIAALDQVGRQLTSGGDTPTPALPPPDGSSQRRRLSFLRNVLDGLTRKGGARQ